MESNLYPQQRKADDKGGEEDKSSNRILSTAVLKAARPQGLGT